MEKSRSEKGAVAVEMALLLPVLIMLLFGIMEFGRALNTQATLTHAARESVRVMAISGNIPAAKNAALVSTPTLSPALTPDSILVGTCPASPTSPPSSVTVTINYQLNTLTGIAGPFAMKATGVMLCGG